MLDTDFKERWVAALRSGNYAQTRNHLKDGTGYCCLGVACDLLSPDDWLPSEDQPGVFMNDAYPYTLMAGSKGVGLNSEERSHLIHLNDAMRQSFDKIADYVETL